MWHKKQKWVKIISRQIMENEQTLQKGYFMESIEK